MGSFLDVLMRNEHMDMSRSLAHEGRPREQRNDTNFTTLPTVEQWDRCTYAVGLLCLSLESGVWSDGSQRGGVGLICGPLGCVHDPD